MASLPPVLQRATREHPLLTLGVVMGLLLAGLLALPFLARTLSPVSPPAMTVIGAVRHS
jgi:hypothetical protein